MQVNRKDINNYYKRLTHYNCKKCNKELKTNVEGYYCSSCNIKYYEHWNYKSGTESIVWIEAFKQNE